MRVRASEAADEAENSRGVGDQQAIQRCMAACSWSFAVPRFLSFIYARALCRKPDDACASVLNGSQKYNSRCGENNYVVVARASYSSLYPKTPRPS